MDNDFECMTTSTRNMDITSHIDYFQPDAFIYCFTAELKDEMLKLLVALEPVVRKNIKLIIIGDEEICNEFMRLKPELDGVETTHIIRRFHPEYKDVSIIALTANAISGTKEMFLREGMNDFVAKPIEMRTILSKLRTWLPKHKIQKVNMVDMADQKNEVADAITIEGLDVEGALKLLGSEKLF